MAADERRAVLLRRLATQRLTTGRLSSGAEVVSLLGAVQSQEHGYALWSLGMRAELPSAQALQEELDRGAVVRTHVLRPTWHYVAAADLRWMLAVTSPRVQQLNGTMYRKLGLPPEVLGRAAEVIVETLVDRGHPTRPELGAALEAAGLPAGDGVRLAYLVMHAELEGLVCSGPMRGAQQTYAVVDERVPARPGPVPDREELLGRLAARFFGGHGPAGVRDLARWASLTLAEARTGVAAAGDQIVATEVDGHRLWGSPAGLPGVAPGERVLLLPTYDEVVLTYPDLGFPLARGWSPAAAPHLPGYVLVDATHAGRWRRTVRGTTVVVEVAVAPGLGSRHVLAVEDEAERFASWLGKRLELVSV